MSQCLYHYHPAEFKHLNLILEFRYKLARSFNLLPHPLWAYQQDTMISIFRHALAFALFQLSF